MIAVKARITAGREELNKLPDIENLIVMMLTLENIRVHIRPRINVIGFINVGFLIEGFTLINHFPLHQKSGLQIHKIYFTS